MSQNTIHMCLSALIEEIDIIEQMFLFKDEDLHVVKLL